ncbi:MAG: M20/M25/M40 family metallo-hydrolase [Mongoliibacter sp.]|uniref:M20/M25/M40 family metallo-hydrolase n=1 Tax=Mongoliibacter sp. TaxID=2022438 RepID=UPI0012F3CF5F|nr:M20/M25/M40 family metallo-hydrolase [Mongoliibacter sp.]TVP49867.1 MAG: M20/M25/M40 family metallo-hydrolase [Mongoliibacter sp.]
MPLTDILSDILEIQSTSGDESPMRAYLFNLIQQRSKFWNVQPEVFSGRQVHDCLLLKFGEPRGAVFAHMDTIGFMSRYQNQLVAIGGPEIEEGTTIIGKDELGPIRCKISESNGQLFHNFPRQVVPGTRFSFEQQIRINENFIQAAYLDNRLGIYNAIKLCETIQDGWIVFTTYEEHGGGSMPAILNFIQQKSPISFGLISDITWVTDGVTHDNGVVISVRDKHIPRKSFLDEIIKLASESNIPYQLEIEDSGSSDGREIQFSPYFIDWCFIGAPEDNVHSPNEKVSWADLNAMIEMYKYLMHHL